MIQRIQSIYLFIASVLLFITTVRPISHLVDPSSHSQVTIYALKIVTAERVSHPFSIMSTGILIYISIILGFSTILLFKKRKLQMLISSLLMVFTFLICNLIVANSFLLLPSSQASMSFEYISIFPLVALILFFLAYKAINKDDKLVKSLDRIR
jgi:hypothetical protein